MFIYPELTEQKQQQKLENLTTTHQLLHLTAISLNENREMLLSFGMNDVVTKPFAVQNIFIM